MNEGAADPVMRARGGVSRAVIPTRDTAPGLSGIKLRLADYLQFAEEHKYFSEIIGPQSLPGTVFDGVPGMVGGVLAAVRGYTIETFDGGKILTSTTTRDGVRMVIQINNDANANTPAYCRLPADCFYRRKDVVIGRCGGKECTALERWWDDLGVHSLPVPGRYVRQGRT